MQRLLSSTPQSWHKNAKNPKIKLCFWVFVFHLVTLHRKRVGSVPALVVFFGNMINRQLIRIKAVQVFYAYSINSKNTSKELDQEFEKALDNAHELYLFLLNFLFAIRQQAETLAENIEAHNKRLGVKADVVSAERRLADNQWLLTLACNNELQDYRAHHNDQNDAEYALAKRLTKDFLNDEDFLHYLKKEDFSPEADQEIARRLYKKIIVNCEDFDGILEDRSLYWNDDKQVIDTFVLKTIRRIQPNEDPDQPLLPAWGEEDDKTFAQSLLHEAVSHSSEALELIKTFASSRFDFNRIPVMDSIILQVAIGELIGIDGIDVSITLNEYINIARWYSTPQSPSFVNAMLDSIAKQLRHDGRMLKPISMMRQ